MINLIDFKIMGDDRGSLIALEENHNVPFDVKRVYYIFGCNFSCYKEDFLAINGFDETYKLPSVGEDIDLGWRFRGLGIELKSCRNNACMMHLWHKKRFAQEEGIINNKILKVNFDNNTFVCTNGISKLSSKF